jgi:hypothetical protein
MRVQRTLSQSLTMENLSRWSEIISQAVGGKLSYGSTMGNADKDINLQVWKATGTSPATADTDFTINHSLGKVPVSIVGQDTTNGALLYRGSVPWTATTVTLRANKASSVYNVILG